MFTVHDGMQTECTFSVVFSRLTFDKTCLEFRTSHSCVLFVRARDFVGERH